MILPLPGRLLEAWELFFGRGRLVEGATGEAVNGPTGPPDDELAKGVALANGAGPVTGAELAAGAGLVNPPCNHHGAPEEGFACGPPPAAIGAGGEYAPSGSRCPGSRGGWGYPAGWYPVAVDASL